MNDIDSHTKGYAIAAVLGAIGGGLIVALATRAIPKMMSKIMAGMMENMVSRMGENGQPARHMKAYDGGLRRSPTESNPEQMNRALT